MTEPPIDLPKGRLNCFVVGARPADAVYPGRLDRRDYTLQVLTFDGPLAAETFRGVIHLNTPTGPFAKTVDGRFDGGDDLAFVSMLVDRCRTTPLEGGAYKEVEGLAGHYLRREALSRTAFSATFAEVRGSYGRDVPIGSSVAPYGDADWDRALDAAKAHHRLRTGGANLRDLNCLAGETFDGWVNSFDEGPRTLRTTTVLQMAMDGPLLIVDPRAGQLAAVPADGKSVNLFVTNHAGRPAEAPPLVGLEAVYGTPWLSTLLAMMLNRDRHLYPEWCTLETGSVTIEIESLKQRIHRIRRELGRFSEMFVKAGPGGRGNRSVGELNGQATFIVVYDDTLRRLIEREGSPGLWRRNDPPDTKPKGRKR